MQRSKEGSQDFADTKFRAVAWTEPTGSSECQAGRLTVHFNILVTFFFSTSSNFVSCPKRRGRIF